MIPGDQQRLQNLEDNLKQDQQLLKDFEDALRYENNPRIKAGYRRDIESLKESIARYQQEYNQLKQESSLSSSDLQSVKKLLQEMDGKVNQLLGGQQETIELIAETRNTLLARYNASERIIISDLTQTFQASQLKLTETLLDAVETNQVSDAEMQQMLTIIEQKLPELPSEQMNNVQPIADIIQDPSLDFKHCLRVALPIVPLLATYEASIELGTGLSVKETWDWLIQKLKGNQ